MTSSDSTAEIAGPVGVVGTGLMGLGIVGGVARWVVDFGLGELVALCRCLAKAHSGRFASTSWLDGLAAS
ncbi:MAG TPA: hypothetical protein VN831_09865, partial [Bradyrhizobium sp.]|nr:hypothetical protein [Bradyrhizobium sp.]